MKELHSVVLFSYHLAIGVLLVAFSVYGYKAVSLFAFPFVINMFVNNLTVYNVHFKLARLNWLRVVVCSAPLIGVIVTLLLNVSLIWIYVLMAFIGGTLLFTVIRETIPKRSEESIPWFLAGIVFYVLVILVLSLA